MYFETFAQLHENSNDVIPAQETVSQFEKGEKLLIFRNGFTPKFLKKFTVGNFSRPLFSTKYRKVIATQSRRPASSIIKHFLDSGLRRNDE